MIMIMINVLVLAAARAAAAVLLCLLRPLRVRLTRTVTQAGHRDFAAAAAEVTVSLAA